MRKWLSFLLAGALALSLTACSGGGEKTPAAADAKASGTPEAQAENPKYPERTISILVPSKTGGDIDQNGRILAEYLGKELGVNVVISNIADNGGNMAIQQLMDSDANGYTFLYYNGGLFTASITGKIKYSYKDFQIACTTSKSDTQVLVVSADSPYQNADDLAKAISAEPGTVKFAATLGSPSQFHAVAAETAMKGSFKKIDIGSGSDKLVSLLNGEVDVVSSTVSLVKDYVEAGKVRIIGSICTERSQFAQDVPTFKEQGYDLGPNFAATYVLLAKPGTPQHVIDKLSGAVNNVMKKPEAAKAFENLFYAPDVKTGQEAEDWLKENGEAFETMREAIEKDVW